MLTVQLDTRPSVADNAVKAHTAITLQTLNSSVHSHRHYRHDRTVEFCHKLNQRQLTTVVSNISQRQITRIYTTERARSLKVSCAGVYLFNIYLFGYG